MEEQIKELIEKYEYLLSSSKDGFNPCTTCCELEVANSTERQLEEVLTDLRSLL